MKPPPRMARAKNSEATKTKTDEEAGTRTGLWSCSWLSVLHCAAIPFRCAARSLPLVCLVLGGCEQKY